MNEVIKSMEPEVKRDLLKNPDSPHLEPDSLRAPNTSSSRLMAREEHQRKISITLPEELQLLAHKLSQLSDMGQKKAENILVRSFETCMQDGITVGELDKALKSIGVDLHKRDAEIDNITKSTVHSYGTGYDPKQLFYSPEKYKQKHESAIAAKERDRNNTDPSLGPLFDSLYDYVTLPNDQKQKAHEGTAAYFKLPKNLEIINFTDQLSIGQVLYNDKDSKVEIVGTAHFKNNPDVNFSFSGICDGSKHCLVGGRPLFSEPELAARQEKFFKVVSSDLSGLGKLNIVNYSHRDAYFNITLKDGQYDEAVDVIYKNLSPEAKQVLQVLIAHNDKIKSGSLAPKFDTIHSLGSEGRRNTGYYSPEKYSFIDVNGVPSFQVDLNSRDSVRGGGSNPYPDKVSLTIPLDKNYDYESLKEAAMKAFHSEVNQEN